MVSQWQIHACQSFQILPVFSPVKVLCNGPQEAEKTFFFLLVLDVEQHVLNGQWVTMYTRLASRYKES